MASLRAIRALVFATLFTLMTTSLAAPPAMAAPSRAISIAKARSLPLGTVVTVHGTVTTPSGAFESSFFDKGFGLQDARAGIYVSLPTEYSFAAVSSTRISTAGPVVMSPAPSVGASRDDSVRRRKRPPVGP